MPFRIGDAKPAAREVPADYSAASDSSGQWDNMTTSTPPAIVILLAFAAIARAQVEPKDFRLDAHPAHPFIHVV